MDIERIPLRTLKASGQPRPLMLIGTLCAGVEA